LEDLMPRNGACAFLILALLSSGVDKARAQAVNADLPQVPGLIVSLKTGEPAVRAASARILGELGPVAKDAVPALIESLKDDDKEVRRNGIKSLGQMGAAASDAVAPIAEAFADASFETRRAAAIALGGIGDPRAAAALKKARKDPNDKVRDAAKRSLKQLRKA
jgi:HEAT repeat protein